MAACFDVAVAGGGPAGAFAARELARTGVDVVLIDPDTTRPRLEGLGERVALILRQKGLEDALQAASAPMRRSVRWAGLNDTANGERLVRRHDFDAALRHAAIEAGVTVRKARLRRIEQDDPETGVTLSLADGETVTARLMIDARGRQAPSTNRQKGPQTLAIAGLFSRPTPHSGTHVEATPQGWVWSAVEPGFGPWLQICIDADDLPGSGQAALAERMRAFLAQPQFDGRFETYGFEGDLLARPAGLVLSAPKLSLPVLSIGDAAVAIDPLSGHGLFWAISSALAAVPSVLTLLEGEDPDLAARFYRHRVVGTFWRQARIGRDFYRLETDLAAHPFWAARAAWPDNEPAHAVADATRLDRRVVVDGNRLKEREVLITPQDPEGVAFVCGLPVRELLELSRTEARATGPAEALRWLESRGLLSGLPDQPQKATETHTRMRETA
ncbi:NAD(P)/FAD-dependent oxidoreductase [Roseibium aggregatum]|uniref:Pilus assembly protein CpaE n=1 Tax=Roseibium aggregatum TaxID=187304 RepID=A0A926S501_9HYPH|nr:lycopene cyclase family protein [Roseibium aggregatum]MBD1544927.1 pilus assembly protein CpaE [Roseibium aggregatum]